MLPAITRNLWVRERLANAVNAKTRVQQTETLTSSDVFERPDTCIDDQGAKLPWPPLHAKPRRYRLGRPPYQRADNGAARQERSGSACARQPPCGPQQELLIRRAAIAIQTQYCQLIATNSPLR